MEYKVEPSEACHVCSAGSHVNLISIRRKGQNMDPRVGHRLCVVFFGVQYHDPRVYLPYSFQISFFLESLKKPSENDWLLKRTMVKKNEESNPRMIYAPKTSIFSKASTNR